MASSHLPERASLEFLKKLAKERLADMRRADPRAKLAAALLDVAREHGFPSWRALKAEIDRRSEQTAARFVEACSTGDLDALRALLAAEPGLARIADSKGQYGGWTGLHVSGGLLRPQPRARVRRVESWSCRRAVSPTSSGGT